MIQDIKLVDALEETTARDVGEAKYVVTYDGRAKARTILFGKWSIQHEYYLVKHYKKYINRTIERWEVKWGSVRYVIEAESLSEYIELQELLMDL